jgi:molybdopterin synthase sulfur carrier subunit
MNTDSEACQGKRWHSDRPMIFWASIRVHLCSSVVYTRFNCVIRVVLPFHLKNLAKVQGEVQLELAGAVTIGAVLDAIEAQYPVLQGTIRDHGIRYFACKEDLSLEPMEKQLPAEVINGTEPFLVIGAMAGG